MIYLTVCLCLAASALAAPATEVVPLEKQQPTVIPIVSQSEEFEPNGTYKFSYETGNGIKREESSYTKLVPRVQGRSADSNEGGESGSDEIHVQEGSYSYTAPDGTLISVRYIADENGFRPIGDHIPRVPGLSSSVSSAEKSGRALKLAEMADAGSKPSIKISNLEPRSAGVPDDKKPAEQNNQTSSEAPKTEGTTEVPNTEITKTTEAQSQASTTEEVASTESSTLAESTTTAVTDISTTSANQEVNTVEEQKTTASLDTSTTEYAIKEASTTQASITEASTTADITTTAA